MQDMKTSLKKSKEYFARGITREVSFRLKQLEVLKKALEDNEALILEALYQDLGKAYFNSYVTELGLVYNEIDLFLRKLKTWAKRKKVKTPLIHLGARSYIYREPYGTVLIFSPWNYPLQLSLLPLVGAIAAGNTVVLKVSSQTPAAASTLEEIEKKYFPPGFIWVVKGDRGVSRRLLEEKFDYIFFTGSKLAGKEVMEAAARHLTPVTLELGGKSPCILDREADIDRAARRIVWGKYLNSGQTCIAPDYLYVHEEVKGEFLRKAPGYIQKFYGDRPLESFDFNPIVNKKHHQRLTKLLRKGRIITGGSIDEEKLYISPTIIDQVTWEDPVMQEEIFGPILPVLEYKDLKEVVERINSQPTPLALYLFSNNKEVQRIISQEVQFGGGCINDTLFHASSSYLPFGGLGESGMGAYHGETSFKTFSHEKSILKSSLFTDFAFRYPPYKLNLKGIKKIFRWF
ncbi:MAG: aldehyde dehydrogenase [Candidatus Syntrophonatronum acetioxidans]|uniref:Aldehyde dehydrogenase n=1 Tax=Candidatus Syntrophonatronum acetioxidans TaxID=1795816 RepID=A0A424YGJ9_9FIRM|nr:MAG: aldehyde dehydrogenase [Candidatus Syntrophonatronum acetioxidans]